MVQVTDKNEIKEVENALKTPYAPLNYHITRALEFLGQKPDPESVSSIKESISAVEYMCKLITGDKDTTMGKAINTFRSSGLIIHDDLEAGLKKIYHWTSDDAGIRHALMDKASVDVDDAKFMLVICASVVNYLKTMAIKANIDLDETYRSMMSD